ncbi:ribonuclease III [Phormidium sp. CLA17]|uniref:ribonuclease III n=1 Tax=Leptolyngbya sp. Cla-17 TaxID=2803751 RepID=UPI0014930F5C|nr:ribonuclease III [Leptolyngbya sp. Cla-17]MBM0741302.1 ribonuclease III [Leptolyngbya sp. Cla-17]
MVIPYPPRQKDLETLVQKLGLSKTAPINWNLLNLALTHPTVSPTANYEQLEFVGDAVIRLAVAEFLLESYSELPVGEFAAVRSMLVSDRTLARIAADYGLARYLLVTNSALNDKLGEESRLAESFEAILGALYLSTHDFSLIRPWLDFQLIPLIDEIRTDPARQNYKAALQEWTQAHYKLLPTYRLTESDTSALPHRFTTEVWLQDQCLGQGSGRSIKAAEQAAAQVAFFVVCVPQERDRG